MDVTFVRVQPAGISHGIDKRVNSHRFAFVFPRLQADFSERVLDDLTKCGEAPAQNLSGYFHGWGRVRPSRP